jgi:Fe2+ or Zn2+ uptake regulation protein
MACMARECAMTDADPNDPAVQALLSYLGRHPQAADSFTGVARWWVGEDGPFSAEQVRRALDHLVEHGALRRQQLPDGTEWYAAITGPPATRLLH